MYRRVRNYDDTATIENGSCEYPRWVTTAKATACLMPTVTGCATNLK